MLKELEQNISFVPELNQIIFKFYEKNIKCILVGGAVRDFILTGELGNDFDFEVHGIKPSHFSKNLTTMLHDCKLFSSIEQLPFSIIRAYSKNGCFEFSLPRTEAYENGKSFYKHNEFEVKLHQFLECAESFRRRDFTFNAIGVSNTDGELCWNDPYKGRYAIDRKEIDICSQDCFFDPVRFLRLVRFSCRFSFDLSNNLQKKMSRFNLRGLSRFYFFKEGVKSGSPQEFFQRLYEWIEYFQIPIAPFLSIYKVFSSFIFDNVDDEIHLLYQMICTSLLPREEIFSVAQELGIKKKNILSLMDYMNSQSSTRSFPNTKELGVFSRWLF